MKRTPEQARTFDGDCPKGHPYLVHGYALKNGRVICRWCATNNGRRWAQANPVKRAKTRQGHYARNPDKVRNHKLIRAYGITLREYDQMAEDQEYRCPVCEVIPEDMLVVDHDHVIGKVRALLCRACNLKVGVLEHPLYPKLIEYLETHHVHGNL